MKFVRTSPFGELSQVHPRPHSGIDLAMPMDTPLRSVVNGVVEKVVDYGNVNLGKGVIITSEDGKRIIYGHMNDIDVKAGDKINYGDLIGHSGNTGHSTGPHLHFAVKEGQTPINPKDYEDDLQEICGKWIHTDSGKADLAIGNEESTIDIIDLILDTIKIIFV